MRVYDDQYPAKEEYDETVQYGKERDFWVEKFSGDLTRAHFPYDYKPAREQERKPGTFVFRLDDDISSRLFDLSGGYDTRLHIILLCGVLALLHRYTGSADIVVGVPIYRQEMEGDFINTVLALRNQISGSLSVKGLLMSVRQSLREAVEHQNYPIRALLYQLDLPYSEGMFPLFDVAVLLENIHKKDYIEHIGHNMTFSFLKKGGCIEGRLEYHALLYRPDTIRQISGHFMGLLRVLSANLDAPVCGLDMLSEEEKRRLLVDFNDTWTGYPAYKTIDELSREEAVRAPGKIAMVCENHALSYGELAKLSRGLAVELSGRGVKAETPVGIMADRSLEAVIGVLAILEAGGCYVPIDFDYPEQRKQYIINDCHIKLLLTGYEIEGDYHTGVISLEKRPPAGTSSFTGVHGYNGLAYIMYTSGSTGRPRGVMVRHRNVVRLVKNTNFIAFKEGDRMIQTGPLEFDASTFEIWGALLNGLRLYLESKDKLLSPGYLRGCIRKYGITTMWLTSPLFNQFSDMDAGMFAGLSNLLVGGDVLSPVHINRVRHRFIGLNIINGYGPTENTTFSTTLLIDKEYQENIPIGKPIANSTVYIIDRQYRLCPVGVFGEIYLGGDGTARGYLNRPELTNEKFVLAHSSWLIADRRKKKASSSGELPMSYELSAMSFLYKTGDLGRWLSDGNIEFLGRMDHQVKIRGYRVEPGEIENCIKGLEFIDEALVVARPSRSEEIQLCAYVVSGQALDFGELKKRLACQLPDYMVPSFFVQLERFPLTPNKKVNVSALPEPELEAGAGYIGARNKVEEKLVGIWSGVLGVERGLIGIDTDFFELGGHSLKATILMTKILKEFKVNVPLAEIFRTPCIRELAEYINGAVKHEYAPIAVVEKKEYYILSSAQERLYILQQMESEGASIGYNVPLLLLMEGDLQVERLEGVFRELIGFHESLRTSFQMVDSRPMQRVHDEVEFSIEYYDSAVESGELPVISAFVRPFDLAAAPLLRAGVVRLEDCKHLLVVDMHHIITDGTSMGVLVRDFMCVYGGKELQRVNITYKDFSEWQHSQKVKEGSKRQEEYWLEEFAGEIPVLNLPIDFPRPLIQGFEGNVLRFKMGVHETEQLKALTLERDSTLFMTLLASLNVLLWKLSGQEEIALGSPIAARRHPALEGIIGMFVNTLVFKNYPMGEKTFLEFLKEVKDKTLAAFENQEYPFEGLVNKLLPDRDTGRNPLFDVMFAMENMEIAELELPGLKMTGIDSGYTAAKFDLTLYCEESSGDDLLFIFEYSTRLFKEETISRFVHYFKKILCVFITDPHKTLSEIDILADEEKQQILYEFNHTGVEYRVNKTIHQLFEEQVGRTPDGVSIVGSWQLAVGKGEKIGETVQLTYGELNRKSDQVAHWLREKGVQPDTIVGIKMERSIEMIIGILGILKAGGAYLPIDPDCPRERIDYMLKDSGAKILLSELSEVSGLSKEPTHLTHPAQLCYVIYTSGSTGMPKGVPVTHANFSPLIHWGYDHLGIGAGDRVLQNLSYYFDWSVWEIFITLTTGACLYMVSREVIMKPGLCVEFIRRHVLTVLHITPTHYSYLVNTLKPLETLRYLFIGAEKLTYDLVKRSIELTDPACRLFNMYGPTEATIISAVLEIDRTRVDEYNELTSIPIGRPPGNLLLWVLDKCLNLCPVRIAGELYIGGDGVAHGYLNNPELTAEKFIAHELHELHEERNLHLTPNTKHLTLYRTGDLVRWLADGNIEFLGRMDHQVKVRGFRIELGEIENRLLTHEKIKEAIVIAREDNNDKYLCAYMVAKPGETNPIDQPGLREYLSSRLPDYMVPAYFVQLDNIPLNPNGKVDLNALPAPGKRAGKDYIAPRSETEKKLADLWSEILGVGKEKISMNDNFFHLGGHSLSAAMLVSRIHKELNINVPLTGIFKTPSIQGLAAYIERTAISKPMPVEPVEKKEFYPLSPAQRRLYILQRMDVEGGIAYNIPSLWQLEGHLNREKLESAFNGLIRRHESLRTYFTVVNDEPVQRIKEENYKLQITNYKFQITKRIENFIRPFDLSEAPLLRLGLYKAGETNYILLLDMHHIISDVLSVDIFIRDFTGLYTGKRLPPLKIHYKDYTQWPGRQGEKGRVKKQEAYWLKQFADNVPVMNLPIDFSRPPVQDFEGRTLHFVLDDEDNLALKRLAHGEGTTLFMTLLAFFSTFLAKISGQEDLVIGTPIVCRNHADQENIIGLFMNFLALRIFPARGKTFMQVLAEGKEQCGRAFENSDYPFEELVKQVEGDRDGSRNPIFDVMLTMQNPPESALEIPGLKLKPREYENRVSKLDLSLQFSESEAKVFYRFEYCTKLFRAETMEAFVRYFKTMVSAILKDPGRKLSAVEILPAAEKKHLLVDLNETGAGYAGDKIIPVLFEEQAARTPGKTAARSTIELQNIYDQLLPEDIEIEISYEELNEKANQLAHLLRERGVEADGVVGLMVEHPLEKAVGIWGILKSGGAYLPIDPTYPPAVIRDILGDSQVRWLVSETALGDCLADAGIPGDGNVIFIDEIEFRYRLSNPVCTASMGNLAYIIYTSGTTGKPKGTAVEHRGIVNYARWRVEYFGFTGDDKALQPLTYSFDSFCANFYSTFLSGGELVMVPDKRRLDFAYIAGLVREYGVTNVCFAPGLYNTLLETAGVGDLASMRLVVLAGEAGGPALLRKSREKAPHVRIANEYGPTEGTVAATAHPEIAETAVNIIGNPIANAKIYILDDSFQPVFPGAAGEVCIAGDGVARGYLNRPELTAEKFIAHELHELHEKNNQKFLRGGPGGTYSAVLRNTHGDDISFETSYAVLALQMLPHAVGFFQKCAPPGRRRLYKTGDLARWLPGGSIEFLGRKDLQVKVRGHRIELEQVEALLTGHEKIKEALAVTRGAAENKYICAYIVPVGGQEFPTAEIKNYIQGRLPYYMVPSRIIRLEGFPLTPNGKIDRKALPDPDFTVDEEYAAPRGPLEEALVQLWAEVLDIGPGRIGIDSSFFDLGGHSLRATMLVSRIEKEMDVKIPLGRFFNTPTIRELSALMDTAPRESGATGAGVFARGTFAPIRPVEKKEYYPVSSQQKRLYTLRQLTGEGTAYNVLSVHWLKGTVDVRRIGSAFQRLMEKHEAFRTGFRVLEGEPVQEIWDRVELKPVYEELQDRETAADYIKKCKREFDLSRPPLLRVTIVRVAGSEYLMLVDMHHIATDGASTALLIEELAGAYEGEALTPPRVQYKDYAVWQRSLPGEPGFVRQEGYWLKRFAGEIPVLNLPTDYARPALQSFEGALWSSRLSDFAGARLKQACKEYDVTVYMMLMACYQVLLAKYSGQEDVIVGSPVASRDHADTEGIVGMFANTLALRGQPVGEKEFHCFLAEIKQIALDAYENQGYPFEELLENVEVTRDVSRNPLFDTMFVLQDIGMGPLKMGDIEITPYKEEPDTAKFDLTFAVSESGQEITFTIEYCTRLFKEETVARFGMHYGCILEQVLEEPGKTIAEIEMVTEEEKEQLLYDFNDTAVEYPRDKTISQLFAGQVERTPDHVVLVGEKLQNTKYKIQTKYKSQITNYKQIHLTYKELNEQSNRVARFLMEEGVLADSIVGIMMERSIEMIIGILGILKAGGAYLPIDPDYPRERIDYMLTDSGAKILLTELPEGRGFHHSSNQFIIHHCNNLAYVIYTSGSTGKPKGVSIHHGGVVNMVYFHRKVFKENHSSRISQVSSASFDAMAFEVWPCLLTGACLCIIDDETRFHPLRLKEWLIQRQITISFQSTLMAQKLLEETWPETGAALEVLRTAGDRLTHYPLRSYPFRFYNLYGPTEDTIWTTWTEVPVITGSSERFGPPSIGKPAANKQVHILSKDLKLQPVGVMGELYISGAGLARGYLNNPELTADRFIAHELHELHEEKNLHLTPNTKHLTLYRTGDLGRWLADGNIEFLGRMDHQVKIRGFRIELGEIENRLLTHGKIKEAIVIAREDHNDKSLCAYIVIDSNKSLELREYLSHCLPDYMVPAYFVQLDSIPLTPNGKVDRNALPEPGIKTGKNYIAPRNETEKKLAELWSEILGVEKENLGIHDNFFHLGGHSLKATVLLSRIHKELNIDVPLTGIFKTPSIHGLAAYIEKAAASKAVMVKPVEKKEYYPLSSAQRRLYILQQMDTEKGIAYNVPSVWELEGDLNREKLESVFNGLIQRHESFRTFFSAIHGEPVQRIEKENYKLQNTNYKQITNYKIQITNKAAKRDISTIINDFIRPFDLSRAPLLRMGLIKIHGQKHILVVDMHHIISDGLSMGIVVKEFTELYAGMNLPGLMLQYKDYSEWNNRRVGREFIKKQESYWLKQFAGDVPVLELPMDYPRPAVQDFTGAAIHFEINKEETAALKSLAQKQDVTLFMLLLSLYTVFLCKLSGQEDIVVGTPIAGRRHTDLEGVIGMFVNTLALRNFPVMEKTFHRFLKEIKENTIQAFENRDYLYEDLVEQVEAVRDTGRNPLFDTMLALQNMDTPAVQIPGLKVMPYHYETRISKFDLMLTAVELEDRLAFTLEYCIKLFKEETIRRFTGFFKKTVSFILEHHEIKISGIELITDEEKNLLLYTFNDTGIEYPRDKTIHQLFAEQVERKPDHVVLVGEKLQNTKYKIQTKYKSQITNYKQIHLTYKELNEQSNRVARFLIEEGVLADSIVGIMMERCVEMIITIFGILKAGGAYLPIDPDYPRERIDYILKDSGAKLPVTTDDISSSAFSASSAVKSLLPATGNRQPAASLAYVIYTSGSTGRPKGVAVEHSQLVNFVYHMYNRYDGGVDFHDRCLGLTNIMFDVSVWEFFLPLSFGAGLILLPEQKRFDVFALAGAIIREAITLIYLPPALLEDVCEQLTAQRGRVSLNKMLVGVEPIRDDVLEGYMRLNPGMKIINGYGPTETTICATSYNYTSHRPEGEIVPIGVPLSNNRVFLLDAAGHIVPRGIPGEIYISGSGVSRGYINNPELTAEKFDQDKKNNQKFLRGGPGGAVFSKSAPPGRRRHYKTGDLARWLVDGNIRFIGRRDQQVKIRGYRVELGEIAGHLEAHPGIKEAVVVPRNDRGRQYLCAYVVPGPAPGEEIIAMPELKAYLEGKLPVYMIPACYVKIGKVPLNPSGKLDRNALPRPLESDFHSGATYEAPETDIQQIIAETWQDVLGREKVGIRDNFSDLGGNSLDFVKVANKLKEKLDMEITVLTLFTYTTIRSLERYLIGGQGENPRDENLPDRSQLIDESRDFISQALRRLDEDEE